MLKYTEEEKNKILEKYKSNTESQYEFCRKNNINRSTLRGWLRKQEKITQKAASNNETKSTVDIPITITCSKIKIEAKEYSTTLLKEIMEVLNDAK